MDRLSEQNVWNATLWNLGWDAQTENALRTWGVDEFFEGLAGVFPYEDSGPLTVPQNSAFTNEERQILRALVGTLNEAWDCSSLLSGDAFLESSWAPKIASLMREAADVMSKRGGYFSTVREEVQPSIPHPTDCPATVFVPLRDEGVDVWRPVDAEHLSESRYRILGPVPDDEHWTFEPGAIVRCAWRTFAEGAGGMTAISADR